MHTSVARSLEGATTWSPVLPDEAVRQFDQPQQQDQETGSQLRLLTTEAVYPKSRRGSAVAHQFPDVAHSINPRSANQFVAKLERYFDQLCEEVHRNVDKLVAEFQKPVNLSGADFQRYADRLAKFQRRFDGLAKLLRYAKRLEELQVHAQEEGITPNRASEQDFCEFVSEEHLHRRRRRRASLAMLDDGTLRATWRNDKWRLGLRFCGDRRFEYVLLDRTNPPHGKTGSTDMEKFRTLCNCLGVESLFAE